jgi:predicted TIM-barrel fold metal-dependent hydrolase
MEINQRFKNERQRLISFAGIHPLCDGIEEKMRKIKQWGFLGVKIHPDYQGQFITHEGYVKIMECARENDLIVLTHSGVDCGFPGEPVRSTPSLARELIRRVPYGKLVLAHYGANLMEDEVYDILAGEDVYFDTAYMLRFISKEAFLKILEKHGEDKILFASDSPWSDAARDAEILRSMGLSESTLEKILYKNAAALLGL